MTRAPGPPPLTAVVIGGGIGGLTAALALQAIGVRATVLERAPELTAVGAGIQVSPNAARVLVRLGRQSALDAVAVRPVALDSRGWTDGALLGSYAVNGDPPQFGAPHYLIHRADLVAALAAGLPDGALRLGAECVGIDDGPERCVVTLAAGTRLSADLVVAADGIHSSVRARLHGADDPTFSGTVAYRGLVPASDVADLELTDTSTKWWGPSPQHHLVHYFVADHTLVNVVGVVPEAEWVEESWTTRGDVEVFRAQFAGYHPPIPQLVGAVPEVFKWALYDRAPLAWWGTGRITLLGDAAHPMVPFMAQGAAMAIEDAAVLARCLTGVPPDEVPAALARYEGIRRPRTDAMQDGSRHADVASFRTREWVYGYDADREPIEVAG